MPCLISLHLETDRECEGIHTGRRFWAERTGRGIEMMSEGGSVRVPQTRDAEQALVL